MSEANIKSQNERQDRAKYEVSILEAIQACYAADHTDSMEQYIEAVKNFLDDISFPEIRGDIDFKPAFEFEKQIDWTMIPDWYDPKQQGELYIRQMVINVYYDAHRVLKELISAHKAKGLLLNIGEQKSVFAPRPAEGTFKSPTIVRGKEGKTELVDS